MDWNGQPRISTDFTYRGIDAALLENSHVRVLVLPGKGGDILEFRDKRTDVDVLYHADYEWTPPAERRIPSTEMSWNDHYPGGWQLNVPVAGGGMDIPGNQYGHHGESALIPWESEITRDDGDVVTLELAATLRRYPFTITRELRLAADEPRLVVDESVTNDGECELEYVWQHHVALGRPFVGPSANLRVPAGKSYVDAYPESHETNRLAGDQYFEWPTAEGVDGETVDLCEFPPTDAEIHDQAYLLGLDEGWYAVRNDDLDVGFALTFPEDHFEALWYWQAFGGVDESPFWGRNYTAGLEPTTAYPGHSIPDAQRENGTMKTLAPGETKRATVAASTYPGTERVSGIDAAGRIATDER